MLMDALLLTTKQPRVVSFLAKATLFRIPVLRWFLAACGVLPVYRRKDQPNQVGRNELTFEACTDLLEKGGAIGIFPEGVSHPREAVLPLKTGCARIALGSEEKNDFKLGTKILPTGIYFKDRRLFRSSALVAFGSVLHPADFFEKYRKEPQGAVRELTAELEDRLRPLTLHVPHTEDEPFLACLREFFATSAEAMAETLEVNPALVEANDYFRTRDPARYERVRREVLRYCRLTSALGLSGTELDRSYRLGPVLRYLMPRLALAIAGFPSFLWGAVHNFLPYKLPAWVARFAAKEQVEEATIKFVSGLVSFPLFYGLQSSVVGFWAGAWAGLLYLISLPATGLFALFYLERLTGFAEEIRLFFLHLFRRELMERLESHRDRIVQELEQGRKDYEAHRQV
jgi:1-acyl-sn-glycerol-3-phosphate acyltransferase